MRLAALSRLSSLFPCLSAPADAAVALTNTNTTHHPPFLELFGSRHLVVLLWCPLQVLDSSVGRMGRKGRQGGGGGGGSQRSRRRRRSNANGDDYEDGDQERQQQQHPAFVVFLAAPRHSYDSTSEPDKTRLEFLDWEPVFELVQSALVR